MKMKMILPMMLIAALLQVDGRRTILFLPLTAVMAVLTSWLRTTTSASTPFFLNSRRRLTRLEPLSRNCLISTNSLWMLTAATRLESLQ